MMGGVAVIGLVLGVLNWMIWCENRESLAYRRWEVSFAERESHFVRREQEARSAGLIAEAEQWRALVAVCAQRRMLWRSRAQLERDACRWRRWTWITDFWTARI